MTGRKKMSAKKMSEIAAKPEPVPLDLDASLEDEVFLPGTAPLRPTFPYDFIPLAPEVGTDTRQCRPSLNKFHHLPYSYGDIGPDPLIGSDHIMKLGSDNFKQFIDRNRVLVMFYASVNNHLPANALWSANELIKAAGSTRKGNHGYASVDCTLEGDLCDKVKGAIINKNVQGLPFFNVFGKGEPVVSVPDVRTLNAAKMKRLVTGNSRASKIVSVLTGCIC